MKKFGLILWVFLVLVCSTGAQAATVTLTFGELPFQPVDGLSFNGVTFGFTVGGAPSTDANYNSFGPGIITYVQDPSLEGNAAGTLTLDFAVPTPILQFGAALSIGGPFARGFSVELFDPALASLGVFDVATASVVSFTESRFSYQGPPVSRAVVTFNSAAAARFALDNLTFDDGTAAVAPVPSEKQPNFTPGGKRWEP